MSNNNWLPEIQDYYTVEEILRQAEQLFKFKRNRHIEPVKEVETRTKTIKRYINDNLEERLNRKKASHGNGYMYPWNAVCSFFENDRYHLHLLKVSVEVNQAQEKAFKEKAEQQARLEEEALAGKKRAPTPAERTEKEKAAAKANDKKIEAEESAKEARKRAEWAEAEIKQMTKRAEEREKFRDSAADFYLHSTDDGYAGDTDVDFEIEIESARKRIFFQYLFDSLIDFDVDEYRRDLQRRPEVGSEPAATNDEVDAANRVRDLHNYYKGKVDLKAALEALCNLAKEQ